MLRSFLAALPGLFLIASGGLSNAAPAEPPLPAKAESLMTGYRTNANIDARLQALRGLEKIRGSAVEDFLLTEYGKLDGTNPQEARLLGGILRVWATRPDRTLLPYLIYEGLFHDDADVVRACAAGIAEVSEEAKVVMSTGMAARGKDPAEELAADLVHRLSERAELLPPIEKVLVLWSGKARPGFKADASLKRVPGEKERAAALEFWQGWFEQQFKRKLKPAEPPAK